MLQSKNHPVAVKLTCKSKYEWDRSALFTLRKKAHKHITPKLFLTLKLYLKGNCISLFQKHLGFMFLTEILFTRNVLYAYQRMFPQIKSHMQCSCWLNFFKIPIHCLGSANALMTLVVCSVL